jgi:hypothetical protein
MLVYCKGLRSTVDNGSPVILLRLCSLMNLFRESIVTTRYFRTKAGPFADAGWSTGISAPADTATSQVQSRQAETFVPSEGVGGTNVVVMGTVAVVGVTGVLVTGVFDVATDVVVVATPLATECRGSSALVLSRLTTIRDTWRDRTTPMTRVPCFQVSRRTSSVHPPGSSSIYQVSRKPVSPAGLSPEQPKWVRAQAA